MNALEILADHLKWHHRNYTTDDVALSKVPGYLECLKPCPEKKFWLCGPNEYYHTIDICGIGCARRDERGRFQSPYRLWRELHGCLNAAGEAKRDENGLSQG